MALADRFWRHIEKGAGCWLWSAALKPNGYAMIGEKMRGAETKWYVHRLSWRIHFGEIPQGLDVCHHCDVRNCVRPDHLFLGTRAHNLADMRRKVRGYSAFRSAPIIHRVAIEHSVATRKRRMGTCRVLLTRQVVIVKDLLQAGRSQDSVAAELGVSQSIISRIKLGQLRRGYDSPVP